MFWGVKLEGYKETQGDKWLENINPVKISPLQNTIGFLAVGLDNIFIIPEIHCSDKQLLSIVINRKGAITLPL